MCPLAGYDMNRKLRNDSTTTDAEKVEYYKNILNQMSEGYLRLDKNLCYVEINKALCAITGLNPEQMIGRYIWDVFPDAVNSETYHAIEKANREQVYVCNTDYNPVLDLWQENHIYPSPDGLSILVKNINAQKKSEHALQLAEERAHALFEKSEDIIALTAADGRLIYVSPALERITGYSFEEIKGSLNTILTHPDNVEESQKAFQELIRNPDKPIKRSTRFIAKNGKTVFLEGTATNLLNNPSVQGIVTNFHDVTDKKNTEKLLEASESLYQNLFQNLLQGFVYCKVIFKNNKVDDFTIIAANNAYSNIVELPDPVGKTISSVFSEYRTQNAHALSIIEEVVKTRIPQKTEYYHARVKKWISAFYYCPSEGYFACLLEDVSERKHLAQQQELFTSIINNTEDAIISKDLNGKITSWNKGAEKLYGYNQFEILGKNIRAVIPVERFGEESQILGKIVRGEAVEHYETQRLRKNGELIYIALTASPIKDTQGNIIGASVIARNITHKKILNQQQALYKAIVNSSQDAIFSRTANGIITTWNHAAEKLFGYTVEEAIGMSIAKFMPRPLPREEAEVFESIMVSKKVANFEATRIKKNGEPVEVSLSVSEITDQDGMLTGYSLLARDITEQKKTTNQLKMYAAIINSTQEAVYSTDLNGTITSWNHAAELLYGYQAKEALGMSFINTLPPDRLHEAEYVFSSITSNKFIKNLETNRIKKDGGLIAVSLTISAIVNANNQVEGVSIIARDITERNKLLEKQSLLASIIISSLDAIFSCNLNKTILSWNPAAERLFGYPAEEIIGTSFTRLVPLQLVTEAIEAFQNTLGGQEVKNLETQRVRKDGQLVYVSISLSQITDSSGGIIGISVIARDIGLRKKTEENLRLSKNNLRTIIENSTECFVLLDTELRVIAFNTKARESILFQFGSNQLEENTPFLNYINPERKEYVMQMLQKVMSGIPANYETDYYKKHQERLWFYANVIPVYEKDVVSGICVAVKDITRQKKAEIRIREAGENLKAIVENSTQGFVLLEPDTTIKLFNRNASSYGHIVFKQQLKKGRRLLDMVEKKRVAFIKESVEQVLKGQTVSYSEQYKRDNKTIWLQFSFSPVINPDGHITALCLTGSDITGKKLAEETREFEKNNLQSLINNTSDLMWSVDLNYCLITCNTPFSKIIFHLTGKQPVRGETILFSELGEEMGTNYKELYDRAFTGKVFKETMFGVRPYENWFEISFYPIYKGEEIIGTACFAKDITEATKNAIEREKMIIQLSQNNKDLKQFAYITSHNLRGPIANLLGLTSLLDNYPIKNKTLNQIHAGIKTAAHRFDETIKDLSTILVVKDNTSVPQENLLFAESFKRAFEQHENLINETKARVEVNFNEAPAVWFNKSYLDSIFNNLLSNAIKYRDIIRPLVIRVKSEKQGNEIVLHFADNGIGFDQEVHKDKLFKLYQRFHEDREGRGMGLFLIKSQLETLGGGIELKSTVNQGTSFLIRFKNEAQHKTST